MSDNTNMLLRSNLKQLRLPAMVAEFEKLAREAGAANETYEQYLLRLTELAIATRANNALQARVRQAGFPVPLPQRKARLKSRAFFLRAPGQVSCQPQPAFLSTAPIPLQPARFLAAWPVALHLNTSMQSRRTR
jgi:hypothetical protein